MRKTHFLILTFVIFLPCFAVPTSFAQGVPDYTVGLIYFLPRGKTPQPNINEKFDAVLKESQKFYADEMERHGYGRKTFKFQTDRRGNAIVHHVKGKFKESHYHVDSMEKIEKEIRGQFDVDQNIYLVVIDAAEIRSKDILACGIGSSRVDFIFTRLLYGGLAVVAIDCLDFSVTAHELGHTFGLDHDFHNDTYIMSYGEYPDELSPCHAEWLDVHRYFNTNRTYSQFSFPQIEMAPPTASPPCAVRLHFEVTASNGLHQAQLLTPATAEAEAPGSPKFVDCKPLKGQSATVEFVTTELVGIDKVILRVMDVDGIFNYSDFPIDVDHLLPRDEAVSIPNANLAAAVRKALGLARRDRITQLDMLKLTSLEAERQLITDLTGIEYAKNLKFLTLGGNQIRDITSLTGLTQLKSLFLPDNQINDITPLAGLPHLTVLNLDSNQISDIRPFIGTKLRVLRINKNPILNTVLVQTLLQNSPKLELDMWEGILVWKVPPPSPPTMYWIDTKKGVLRSVTAENVRKPVGTQNASSFAVDITGGKLYWAEKTGKRTGRILQANIAGQSNIQVIKEPTSLILDIALDTVNGKMYLVSSWGKIQRLNVDGTDFEANLIKGLKAPSEIALDVESGKVYWTEQSSTIRRANLDGSNIETLVTGLSHPTGIAVGDGKLYWTTQPSENTGKIQRANLNGSNVRSLATGASLPRDIVVDRVARKLYWANALGSIQRADLDGQNVQTLATGLSAPAHLALVDISEVSKPEPIVTPDAEIAKITGPWLWMIAPTEPGKGGKRSTNVDSLRMASGGAVTEAKVAKKGARAGAVVGDYAWTPGTISETGENNINDVVNKIGLVKGQNRRRASDDIDINDHSAYALITLVAAKAQSGVTMRVGSDDSIKVWLNGKVVYKNPVDRGATDFLDRFNVRLKKGDNLLLVKVSELWGGWSMFVGIDADVKTKQPSVAQTAAPVLSVSAALLPTETVLLSNYPNPFNPETWIPYQLTEPAAITVTIYSVDGHLIRTLPLGHQAAGVYQDKSRAAYWDGKNTQGEPVASGVYFYTLKAGEFTATRKMLIRK